LIRKYFLFSIIIILFFVILNSIFTPLTMKLEKKEAKYSDWFKKIYSDFIWVKLNELKTKDQKFEIIKNVLKYNSNFKEAEDELCLNVNYYLVSNIKTVEIIDVLKNAYDKHKTQEYSDCLVESFLSIANFDEAIDFLKSQEQTTKNPYEKNYFFQKIKETVNNKNIFMLTKALQNYYYDKKSYPGDITILKDLGYIENIPQDPNGGQYYLAEKGLIRSTSARK